MDEMRSNEEIAAKWMELKQVEENLKESLQNIWKMKESKRIDHLNDVDSVHSAVRTLEWILKKREHVLHPSLRKSFGLEKKSDVHL